MSTPDDPTSPTTAPPASAATDGELRRLRDLLAAAGRLAEFGRFAAQQIHELRQPLFAIKGLGQLLLEKDRVELDEVLDFARHIVEQSERLTGLVANLRQLSVPAQGTGKARTEVGAVLVRVTSLLDFRLRKAGVTLRTQIAPDVPPVAAAPHALEQILINLLANALDAVSGAPGPIVQLRARVMAENPRFALIEVADNGPGIAKAVRSRLFESFFTTKGDEQGTGLGLAVSREIARGAGGDLVLLRGSRELERAGRHRLSPDAARVAGALRCRRPAPLLVLALSWTALGAVALASEPAPTPPRQAGSPAHAQPAPTPEPQATTASTTIALTPARASLKLGVDQEVEVAIDLTGPDADKLRPAARAGDGGDDRSAPPRRARATSPRAISRPPIASPRSRCWSSSSATAPRGCTARRASRSRGRRCFRFTPSGGAQVTMRVGRSPVRPAWWPTSRGTSRSRSTFRPACARPRRAPSIAAAASRSDRGRPPAAAVPARPPAGARVAGGRELQPRSP